ncbi:hypothetical protein AALP_AA5G204800 [Arabis alpina]|uniref:Uncharacterized protein n=1 Tax=Arabis alpina TaxID=50452 RepID=A0A087GYC4_ARAAL|nr:hypothetical protein AALP_AA5G204800 [Arabis alpina]
MERNDLGELKSKSLKVFESRKYVKAVREVMNQMIEAWKRVPNYQRRILRSHLMLLKALEEMMQVLEDNQRITRFSDW